MKTYCFLLQASRYLFESAKSGDVNKTNIFVNSTNDSCTENDGFSYTLLMYAAMKGHVEVVRVLLEGGANVERSNSIGITAMHEAVFYGRLMFAVCCWTGERR